MKIIICQPDADYFLWQCRVQMQNFKDHGYLQDAIYLFSFDTIINQKSVALVNDYGVDAFWFKDERADKSYPPGIVFHLLWKYFLTNPVITFIGMDVDALFTRRIDLTKFNSDSVYLADPVNDYLSSKYIASKSAGLLEEMAAIVGIDAATIIKNDPHCGGAQYIFNEKILVNLWSKIESDSTKLHTLMVNTAHKYTPKDSYAIQAWTAGMWSLIWNLWHDEINTERSEELSFCWPTQPIDHWEKFPFFHNAGVTDKMADRLFFKGKYVTESPFHKDHSHVDIGTCSYEYVKALEKSAI